MNGKKQEIYNDLLAILVKIDNLEQQTNQLIVEDDVVKHISYAIEFLTGDIGLTDMVMKEKKEIDRIFKSKIN